MKEHFLDFERPLAEIIEKIEALQAASNNDPELLSQIEKLRKEEEKLKFDEKYIERIAREKFKMVKPGERVFKVVED